jgi:hypothetical protein
MVRSALPVVLLAWIGVSDAGTSSTRTQIMVWASVPPTVTMYGGASYGGGYTPPTGAMITERRELEVGASSEMRIAGVAASIDPASVQLRDLTDPSGIAVTEQRYVPGATTPDELLARHIGDAVTVVTEKGEVAGVLRAASAQALVVEVGSGDQRHLQVMDRDRYVQDVRLPAGTSVDKPSLVWHLSAKKPGKHAFEVSYRAEAMSWAADYLAVLDEVTRTIDFSAWATVKNLSGASFDSAELTLATTGTAPVPAVASPYLAAAAKPALAPMRFTVPAPVHLGNGESVQVELLPPRTSVKARSVVTYEAVPDASAAYQGFPAIDCNQVAGAGTNAPRAEVALELDIPNGTALPDGRARLFRRKGDRLDVVSEDPLRSSPGVARMRVAADADIIGERHALSCTGDERTRTIHEKIEVKVENKGKQPTDVIVREYLWRWPVWRIDPADESPRGVRAGTQTQEYRVNLPPGARKTVTYSVVYTW